MIALLLVLGCKDEAPGEVRRRPVETTETTTTTTPETGTLRFRGPVPQNLLFVSIDTFRKDHLGFHGSDKGLTPFLDSLAEDGFVLEDHLQCSNWTYGSTTCTLAGRTSTERGQLPRLNGEDETRTVVPEGTGFLATWLGEAGYTTGLVSSNTWLAPQWGNTQGYEHFQLTTGNATSVGESGMALLQTMQAPWFLHLHLMEPHASYNPPDEAIVGLEDLEPFPVDLTRRPNHYEYRDAWPLLDDDQQALLEAHLRVLYEGEIRTVDYRLAEVWAELDAGGWLDDTLVVIWNDHGEAFWEHGWQTHAYRLNAEENDGFALFWSKDIVPGRYEGPTTSIDLPPTILDLHGLPVPEEVTGWPVGQAPDDRPRFGETVGRLGAAASITRDGWKMQYSFLGVVEVNDRNTDPTEQIDLYDPTDPWQLELWAELKPFAEAMEPLIVQPGPVPVWPKELP